jgi:hypothetical protein
VFCFCSASRVRSWVLFCFCRIALARPVCSPRVSGAKPLTLSPRRTAGEGKGGPPSPQTACGLLCLPSSFWWVVPPLEPLAGPLAPAASRSPSCRSVLSAFPRFLGGEIFFSFAFLRGGLFFSSVLFFRSVSFGRRGSPFLSSAVFFRGIFFAVGERCFFFSIFYLTQNLLLLLLFLFLLSLLSQYICISMYQSWQGANSCEPHVCGKL